MQLPGTVKAEANPIVTALARDSMSMSSCRGIAHIRHNEMTKAEMRAKSTGIY